MIKNVKNLQISPDYQKEIEKIREKVKHGNCFTLRECLLLFEELWDENHPNNILISKKIQKKLEKLNHDDPKQYSNVINKINQIQKNPEHYKPLSGAFYGSRRAHIGDFVLIYHIEDRSILILDYDHHKRVYE